MKSRKILYVAFSIRWLLICIYALRAQSTSPLTLHPEEETLFTQVFNYLAAVNGGGRVTAQVEPNAEHIEALIHVLNRWPAIHRFPCA